MTLPPPFSVIGRAYNSLVYLVYTEDRTKFSSGIFVDYNKALVPSKAVNEKDKSTFMVRTQLSLFMLTKRKVDYPVGAKTISGEIALILVSGSRLSSKS